MDAEQTFQGKPEGKRPYGTPKIRWKDNIIRDGGNEPSCSIVPMSELGG